MLPITKHLTSLNTISQEKYRGQAIGEIMRETITEIVDTKDNPDIIKNSLEVGNIRETGIKTTIRNLKRSKRPLQQRPVSKMPTIFLPSCRMIRMMNDLLFIN